MRAFSYAWSLSVTWQRWQSYHSIRRIRKPHVARKLHCSMFYRTGFIADRTFTLREEVFSTIAPVTFTLTRWPSYTKLIRILHVRKWTSYVKAFESHCITACECVHLGLVTRGHFRSRDKDGDHIIRYVIAEKPVIHANLMAPSFIEQELLVIEAFFTLRE